MEEKKETWTEAIAKAIGKVELENISLGMQIEKLRNEYFYEPLIKYLKGDDSALGHMYFKELKPLYDKYGYEKVNRILLALDKEEKGDGADE